MNALKLLLDKKADLYNNQQFIETDPIQIPHKFKRKEDIEIAAFLAATIAWGQRKNIIKSATNLLERMDNAPFDYIMESVNFKSTLDFKYRTFQPADLQFFLLSLRNIYKFYGGLENVFNKGFTDGGEMLGAIAYFRNMFFAPAHLKRTEKHVSNVINNSAGKRLNLFLRWMVRDDNRGVDFALWKNIPASALMLPLDLHSGNVARKLGLLKRKQNDWKAVLEITELLRKFDSSDPVKYDFALFGMGAFENIS